MMELFATAIMISGFVLVMMLLIEYLNGLSAGRWQATKPRRGDLL